MPHYRGTENYLAAPCSLESQTQGDHQNSSYAPHYTEIPLSLHSKGVIYIYMCLSLCADDSCPMRYNNGRRPWQEAPTRRMFSFSAASEHAPVLVFWVSSSLLSLGLLIGYVQVLMMVLVLVFFVRFVTRFVQVLLML